MLDEALDQLDDDKRAVFVLFELEQMPMVDVAEAAGCPLQTAYSRLYAARKIVWRRRRSPAPCSVGPRAASSRRSNA